MATAHEVVDEANALAREFYALSGNVVREGYCFELATHPQEQLMWAMAVAAFDRLRATSVDDCLSELTEGSDGD